VTTVRRSAAGLGGEGGASAITRLGDGPARAAIGTTAEYSRTARRLWAPTWAADPPTRIAGLAARAIAIAAGGAQTCAVLADETVECWTYGNPRALERVPGTEGTEELAMGDTHACIRNGAGQVRCWGSNAVGQAPARYTIERQEWSLPRSMCSEVNYQAIVPPGANDVAW
jgi:hypothetical protein